MGTQAYGGVYEKGVMKVTREMLHPRLRAAGGLIRTICPCFTPGIFRFCNRILDGLGKGRAFTSKVGYAQAYVPREDGSQLRLCVYTPKKRTEGAVGLLWLHGGGYAMGIPEQDLAFIKRFILASGCVVVSPDYVRSLDAPYPAALEDCYRALLWLKENAQAYGVRDDRLFAGGDSAGGGLTAALCLLARDRGEASIAFQMPLYPMLDDRMDTVSARENDAPVWSTASSRAAWKLYLGDAYQTDGVSQYAAPARAAEVSGLPPALTFVGSAEPFRDETAEYVRRLREAGIPASLKVFEGCFHAFDTVCPRSPMAKEAAAFLVRGFLEAAERWTKPQPE